MRSYCPHCQWDQQETFKLKFDHIQTFYKEKGIWKCSQNVSHLFQYDIRRLIVISQILDGRDLNITETNVKFHSDMGITKPHFSPQSRGFRNLRDSRSDASCHYRDVSNHQPRDCLLNRLFRRRSKKTSKLRVTGLCEGNSPVTGPVTRKMFPFDDVIMRYCTWCPVY